MSIDGLSIEERRAEVARLSLAGFSQRQIADTLEVSQATICLDLQEVRKQWKESAISDYGEQVAQELQRLDNIYREAMQGWERSQQDEVVTEERTGKNGYASTKTKPQAGTPSFLNTAKDAVDAKSKLLGLNAPEKHEVTGPELKVVIDEDFFGNAARFEELGSESSEAYAAAISDTGTPSET